LAKKKEEKKADNNRNNSSRQQNHPACLIHKEDKWCYMLLDKGITPLQEQKQQELPLVPKP